MTSNMFTAAVPVAMSVLLMKMYDWHGAAAMEVCTISGSYFQDVQVLWASGVEVSEDVVCYCVAVVWLEYLCVGQGCGLQQRS